MAQGRVRVGSARLELAENLETMVVKGSNGKLVARRIRDLGKINLSCLSSV